MIELTDSGALTLVEAIVGLACDDITVWLKTLKKKGWDFDGDWAIPEIPSNVHRKIRLAKTTAEKRRIYSDYYSKWKYDYYTKKKNYEDAKDFLLGGENGWITLLTEADGGYIYNKVIEQNGNLNTYIKRGVEKG